MKSISTWVIATLSIALWSTSPPSGGAVVERAGAPTELPASCSVAPHLAAVTPSPHSSSKMEAILNLPGLLAAQYPTVFGAVKVAPATHGVSATGSTSHFIVLERVHDPALESEARSVYASPLTVTFALTPRTARCLNDINASIRNASASITRADINLVGYGPATTQVDVNITACKGSSAMAAEKWFATRWGSAVKVNRCSKVASTLPLITPSQGAEEVTPSLPVHRSTSP